jgi:hypothetical protein
MGACSNLPTKDAFSMRLVQQTPFFQHNTFNELIFCLVLGVWMSEKAKIPRVFEIIWWKLHVNSQFKKLPLLLG